MPEENALSPVELATELTVAWLTNQNNRINADEVPEFLRTMYRTITELSSGPQHAGPEQEDNTRTTEFTPAVSVRKSLASKDHIISMIDGKPYRTLRRHLSTHGLTPKEYRERYNLRADYPMVAPSYSEARRAMAHKIGLGAKGRKSKSSAPAAAKPGVRKARNGETSEG